MRPVRLVVVLAAAVLSACASPTATPEPAATALPTDPPPTIAPSPIPPTEAPEPTVALPTVPNDPDEFAAYMLDRFGTIGGVDLAPTESTWITPTFLQLSTDSRMAALTDVGDDAKLAYATDAANAMIAYTGGGAWTFYVRHRYLESSAVEAGELSVTMDDWVNVSDEYDADDGGFWISQNMVQIMAIEGVSYVVAKVFPSEFELR